VPGKITPRAATVVTIRGAVKLSEKMFLSQHEHMQQWNPDQREQKKNEALEHKKRPREQQIKRDIDGMVN
jgi:hypothetical protein